MPMDGTPARVGGVVAGVDDSQPFGLVDSDGVEVAEVGSWARDLVLGDRSPRTVRAYIYAMLSWYRVLVASGCGVGSGD